MISAGYITGDYTITCGGNARCMLLGKIILNSNPKFFINIGIGTHALLILVNDAL